jgi:hypothetical protein
LAGLRAAAWHKDAHVNGDRTGDTSLSLQRPLISPRSLAMAFAVLAIASTALLAQLAGVATHDMSWFTVDAGGGSSAAGAHEFIATIGQADASSAGALSGGGYVFSPGFWNDQQLGPHRCDADVAPAPNGDGLVNVDDLTLVILTWGPGGAGDADGNGTVDVDDLIAVILAWGVCP